MTIGLDDARHSLLHIPNHKRQVEYESRPVSIDKEKGRQEDLDAGFGDDIGIEAVAEVNGIDVVAGNTENESKVMLVSIMKLILAKTFKTCSMQTDHSRSLYIIVKKTWRNRLTALIRTARRYSQASPFMVTRCGRKNRRAGGGREEVCSRPRERRAEGGKEKQTSRQRVERAEVKEIGW